MKTKTYDGLRFGVPEGRKIITENGRILLMPNRVLRTIDRITIWIAQPTPLPDSIITNGTDPTPHSLVKIEGGMGGPGYMLSIPKQLGSREITVRAYLQVEYGQPTFADTWAVWESINAVE